MSELRRYLLAFAYRMFMCCLSSPRYTLSQFHSRSNEDTKPKEKTMRKHLPSLASLHSSAALFFPPLYFPRLPPTRPPDHVIKTVSVPGDRLGLAYVDSDARRVYISTATTLWSNADT